MPSPISGSRPPARLDSLTGLRFPAALAVFVYHASYFGVFGDADTARHFYAAVSQAGGLGVTFFFVLSGFVLAWSARPGDTARAFWRRRYVKILPNYAVAWLLAMLLIAHGTTPVGRAFANLLMLHVWAPDFAVNFSVDPPSWSLAAEAFFYLCFPLLLHGVRRIGPRRLKFVIALVAAAIVATPALAHLALPSAPGIPGEPSVSVNQYWFGFVFPPLRLLDFALGVLIARAVLAGRWPRTGIALPAVLLAAAYPLTAYLPYLYGQRSVCVIPVALLIAAVAQADVRGRRSVLRARPLQWLGEVSFAFYLLHFIVLSYGRELLGERSFSGPTGTAVLLAAAGVAVLASWALYAGIERPLARRWSVRRQPAAAPEPVRSEDQPA